MADGAINQKWAHEKSSAPSPLRGIDNAVESK